MDFKTALRKTILGVLNPEDPEVCANGKHCAAIAGQEWPHQRLHGILSALDHNAGGGPPANLDVLTWILPNNRWEPRAAAGAATMEVFYPVSCAGEELGGAGSWLALGYSLGVDIDADNEMGATECYVPWDYTSLHSIVVVFVARVTLTPMTMRVDLNYGAVGEVHNIHTNGANMNTNTTANLVTELDISALVGALAAGDYLGVAVRRDPTQNTDILLLGVRLRYT